MDDFRNQMGMLLDDDEEDEDGVNVFNSGDEDSDEPRSKRSDKNARYSDEDDDLEHPEDEDDFPVFLNESKTKSGLADIERLGGASEGQANESAERIVEDMKAISQYPHAEAPEDKTPDDILEMLKELDDKIDELEQENDD